MTAKVYSRKRGNRNTVDFLCHAEFKYHLGELRTVELLCVVSQRDCATYEVPYCEYESWVGVRSLTGEKYDGHKRARWEVLNILAR